MGGVLNKEVDTVLVLKREGDMCHSLHRSCRRGDEVLQTFAETGSIEALPWADQEGWSGANFSASVSFFCSNSVGFFAFYLVFRSSFY